MDKIYSITIGRQLGSGGRQIGRLLANQLGISFYDKQLIKIASQKSGLEKEFFEKHDEKSGRSFFGGLSGIYGSWDSENISAFYLSNEKLFNIQSEVIVNLAKQNPAVFVGRCADYVLKDFPASLNVFISADLDDRIKRVAQRQQVSEKKAKDYIESTDKKRAEYYNYFSNKTWGKADSYHLCINSSVLGMNETVDLLCHFVKLKFDL